jgi:hypothetical protein
MLGTIVELYRSRCIIFHLLRFLYAAMKRAQRTMANSHGSRCSSKFKSRKNFMDVSIGAGCSNAPTPARHSMSG